MRVNNHTDLLNWLVKTFKLESYLEIGVSIPKNNFDLIRLKHKVGVDPNPKSNATHCMTSDEFFDSTPKPFDLVFVDGLHEAQQVRRDFENALRFITDRGFIVLHDTYPESEHLTHVPRDKKGRWLGDVYKFAMLLGNYRGINFRTLTIDNGCTVVWAEAMTDDFRSLNTDPTWKSYRATRDSSLRVCSFNKLQEVLMRRMSPIPMSNRI